eukprot:gene8884-11983_t
MLKLHISNLRAVDLYNTGSMLDKQDPAVKFSINKTILQTNRIVDPKADCDFPEEFDVEFTEAEFNSGMEMEVEVLNLDGKGKSKAQIGIEKVSLKALIPDINAPAHLCTIPLYHYKNQKSAPEKKGSVIFSATITKDIPLPSNPTPSIPSSSNSTKNSTVKSTFSEGDKIECNYLSKGTYLPGIIKKVNDNDTYEIAYDNNECESNVISTNIRIKSNNSTEETVKQNIVPTQQTVSNKSVAVVKPLSMILFKVDDKVECNYNNKGTYRHGIIKKVNDNDTYEIAYDDSETESNVASAMIRLKTEISSKSEKPIKATLKLERIHATDLADTGSYFIPPDPQDPAVIITIGSREFKTKRQVDGKTEVTFPEKFDIDISLEDIDSIEITVEVLNLRENGTSKAQIGKGSAILKSLLPNFNTPYNFIIDLSFIPMSGKNKGIVSKQGRVEMRGVIVVKDPTLAIPEINEKSGFQQGKLFIKKISCEGLPKTEYLQSTNELYVQLQLSGTAVKSDVAVINTQHSDHALFDRLNLSFDCLLSTILYEKLTIELMDKNDIMSDKLIGSAQLDLSTLVNHHNELHPLTIIIHHPNNVKKEDKTNGVGKITIYFQLMNESELKKVESEMNEIDPAFVEGVIKINSIKGYDLKNSNWLSGFNPYIKLKLKDWKKQTAPTTTGTSTGTPVFDHLDIITNIISRETVSNNYLDIEIWNQGLMGVNDKKIGEGVCSVRPLGYTTNLGKEIELNVDLVTKGSAVGKLVVYALLLPPPVLVDAEAALDTINLPENFLKGYLTVNSIAAHDLKNKELIGKQDPYVKLSFGSLWSDQTSVQSGAGSEAFWNLLGWKCSFTRDELLKTHLKIIVNESNLSGDVLIGQTEIILLTSDMKVGQEIIREFKIYNTKKTKIRGRVVLNYTINEDKPEPEKLVIPPGFTHGYVVIRKIEGYRIPSHNFISTPKLSLSVKHGESDSNSPLSTVFATSLHDNTYVWDDLSSFMRFEIKNSEDLIKPEMQSLTIDVVNEQRKVLFPKIKCALIKPMCEIEKEFEIDCFFVDPKAPSTTSSKGNTNGPKLTFFVTLSAKEIEKVPDEIANPVVDLFNCILVITSIKATKLANVELIGQSDPFIELLYPSINWRKKTTALQDNGSKDLLWSNLNFQLFVSSHDLLANGLQLNVWDENKIRDHVMIGFDKHVSCLQWLLNKDKELTNHVEIKTKDGKSAGKLAVTGMVVEQPVDLTAKKLPESFKKGVLKVLRIITYELLNVEWSIIGGKPDPYLKIKLGETVLQTPMLSNSGANNVFEGLDIEFPVTLDILNSNSMPLLLEAWDDNSLSKDTLIGSANASLKSVNELNQEIEIFVDLNTPKDRAAGRLQVVVMLTEEEENEKDIILPKDFPPLNQVAIKRIRAFQLHDTTSMGIGLDLGLNKQSVYAVLTFPPAIWKETTPVLASTGIDGVWDVLDMTFDVTIEQLSKEELVEVIVLAKDGIPGVKADSVIGTGSVSLKRAASKSPTITEIKVMLHRPPDLKKPNAPTKPAGRLLLDLEVQAKKPDEKEPDKVSEDFEFGVYRIQRVMAFHLTNHEWFGKQDPFVTFSLGPQGKDALSSGGLDPQKAKTSTKDNAGNTVSWEDVAIECDVYREVIDEHPLLVCVYDENDSRPNSLIGKGTLSLKRHTYHLEEYLESILLLTDDKNKPAGKLMVTSKISPPVINSSEDIPESLGRGGMIKVKKIQVIGMKKKIQSFVRVGISETGNDAQVNENSRMDTTPISNSDNPVWNHLEYHKSISNKSIRLGDIIIELIEKPGTLGGLVSNPKTLGIAPIPIRPTAFALDRDTELMARIKDKNGKDIARIILTAELSPAAPEEQEAPKPKLKLPEPFSSGIITISKIKASSLINKELTGKQDPYVKFKLGEWEESTITLNNVGSNPLWQDLTIETEVNREILQDEKLIITVMDDNDTREDALLGFAETNLWKLCDAFGRSVDLTIELMNPVTNVLSGSITVTACLRKAELSELSQWDALPETVVQMTAGGTLKVKQLIIYDVRGADATLLGGSKDPCVVLSLPNGWNGKAESQKKSGRSVKWEEAMLDHLQTPLTFDELKHARLALATQDKKGRLLGNSDISLRRVASSDVNGQMVTYKCKLLDNSSPRRYAGRLEITLSVEANPILPPKAKSSKPEKPTFKKGTLLLKSCTVSGLRNTDSILSNVMGGVNQYLFSVTVGKASIISPVSKNVTKEGMVIWDAPIHSPSMISALELRAKGFVFQVISRSKNPITKASSDQMVGKAEVIAYNDMLVSSPGAWVEVKTNILHENKQAGKASFMMKIVPDGAFDDDLNMALAQVDDGDEDVPDVVEEKVVSVPHHKPVEQAASSTKVTHTVVEEEVVNGKEKNDLQEELDRVKAMMEVMKSSQNQVDQKIGKMSEGIKKQMQKELTEERKTILNEISTQNQQLTETLKNFQKSLSKKKDNKDEMKAVMYNVALPEDVREWRNAHVQHWLAYKLELPQYVPSFQQGSIDGLVLLNHVDKQILNDLLSVSDPIHTQKILANIKLLQIQVDEWKKKREDERLKHLKQLENEKKRQLELLAALEKRREDAKNKPDKTKKQSGGTVVWGEVKEQGMIDRAKIEYTLKQQAQKQKSLKKKNDIRKNISDFEYTDGFNTGPPGDMGGNTGIWDEDKLLSESQKKGTRGYQKTMATEILSSAAFKGNVNDENEKYDHTGGAAQELKPPNLLKLYTLPHNCGFEEVFVAVKGSMFKVSSWLLEVEKINQMKNHALDDDIDEMDEQGQGLNSSMMIDSQVPDLSPLPPPPLTYDMTNFKSEGGVDDDDELANNNDDMIGDDDHANDEEEEEEDESLPPELDYDEVLATTTPVPSYEEIISSPVQNEDIPLQAPEISRNKSKSIPNSTHLTRKSRSSPPLPDRMTLIFNALVNQKSNKSYQWLGKNDKLTRLKLEGGLESLLRIKMEWSQFDSLWTKLDFKRSGDLDLQEFKEFFGDLSEFETKEGTQALTLTKSFHNTVDSSGIPAGINTPVTQNKSMEALLKYLYELCDVLRKADFTVHEMFGSFDRNASGEISISEFCSLLRLVLTSNSSTLGLSSSSASNMKGTN